ncbi:MAG: hypothetical protein U0359_35325 [Byssovorax sp.]
MKETRAVPGERSVVPERIVEIAIGAGAGAAMGAVGGPPGAAIGAVIGGAIGAAAGYAIDVEAHERAAHDQQLDMDIGVIGGDLGEAPPGQPPASLNRVHLASLGIAEAAPDSSDGPIQNVDASER